MTTPSSHVEDVAFFVLRLDDNPIGKAQVLFSVPNELASELIAHPILCRGAAFHLTLSQPEHNIPPAAAGTCFLSTIFESPCPEDTAAAISKRLSQRMKCVREFHRALQNPMDDNNNTAGIHHKTQQHNTSYASSISSHVLGI